MKLKALFPLIMSLLSAAPPLVLPKPHLRVVLVPELYPSCRGGCFGARKALPDRARRGEGLTSGYAGGTVKIRPMSRFAPRRRGTPR